MNKSELIEKLKKKGLSLEYANDELRNDKEVVLLAVNKIGRALKHASKELKNDKEIVLAAIRKDKDALYYASDELKNDKEVVLEAIAQSGLNLYYASEELRNDKSFLYQIKDILKEHKDNYPEEYRVLKSYEREDELNAVLEEKSVAKKSKRKV